MTEINWANFKSKFYNKERHSFESLAYMLFCNEFGIKTGIFRFKNQTGIESEPIIYMHQSIGFQAKYFDDKINKDEIIGSINKAKVKNPTIDKILLYTNLELSESSSKSQKKAALQLSIENAASTIGIEVEWRVPSHVEKQLFIPENGYLAQYFFGTGGEVEFLEKLSVHSNNILGAIQTNIQFEYREIKVDRQRVVSQISKSDSQIILLAGEGGCGKTALVKEIFLSKSTPCYILKAAEFSKPSLTDIFKQFGAYDINDFLRFHQEENKKIFVIDSAEKLSDLNDVNLFIEFLSALISNSWQIIFTTRISYLDDLCFQMLTVYRSSFDIIKIDNLSLEELQKLATDFGFELPLDPRLVKIICNLFYLKEFLANYSATGGRLDMITFRNVIWQKKIQNSRYRKGNIHLARERCFLNLARERCTTGSFFLSGNQCDNAILSLLDEDEVIKLDTSQNGYFITHDIYEEWALEKLIEMAFVSLLSFDSFFLEIGNSLPIRRAFRSWLSEKLYQTAEFEIKYFIEQSFNNESIPQLWKDEILISVLLSEYSSAFFTLVDEKLLDNNKYLLKRITFLLRTACKEVDSEFYKIIKLKIGFKHSPELLFTKPKGTGWEVVINYLFNKIDLIRKNELSVILPLLDDWLSNERKGGVSRTAGLFAFHFYKKSELEKDVSYGDETEKLLLKLVLAAAAEIKTELTEITEDYLLSDPRGNQPFDSLSEMVLTDSSSSITYIGNMPEFTIKLATRYWYNKLEEDVPFYFSGTHIEDYYSISSHSNHDYFPASALQTPIYFLLRFALQQAIDFVLDFTNRTVESYFESGHDQSVHEIDVVIGEKRTKQIVSSGIWAMYRGSGSPVTPYLLQSIHMALEKQLLEIAKSDAKLAGEWLIYLLGNTRSASITAVVASVVLAFPDELFEIAIILFRNYDFFKYDGHRLLSEGEAKSIYSIGYGLDGLTKKFADERLATCEQAHRKLSLENLIINYQFFKKEKMTDQQAIERQHKIWLIIDESVAVLPTGSDEEKHIMIRLLMGRIDRRKMNPIVEKGENSLLIDFNPELPPGLKELREQALQARSILHEYTMLKLWARDKVENQNRYGPYKQYDDNVDLVLEEVKALVEKLKNCDEMFHFANIEVPAYVCSALIKHYFSKLKETDLIFCKDIIISYAIAPLNRGYAYQIGDGVEASISAIPFLYNSFAEQRHDFNIILLFTLFETHAIGQYKRICDYSIEALVTLFDLSADNANIILFGYMMFRPRFDELYFTEKHLISKPISDAFSEFLEKFEIDLTQITPDLLYYQTIDFNTQKLEIAETAFQIIPADTTDSKHLDYIKKLLVKFSKEFLLGWRYKDDYRRDYKMKNSFFKKTANFLLHRDVITVEQWAKLITAEFCITEQSADLIAEIVSAEDRLATYDQFWKIWECFYPIIIDLAKKSKKSSSELDNVVINYLLAWRWWKETAKDWPSLREKEKFFFKKASTDIGYRPAVLYSISKMLNEIGSGFLDDGVFWISDMLSMHKNLLSADLLTNTIYYLEKLTRKYVYLNRSKLKANRLIRDKTVVLLDFLIMKGSVNAYLLREDVF